MSRFEDDLWQLLVREHAAGAVRAAGPGRAADRRRRVLTVAAAALSIAAVTAALALLLSAGGSPPAAYAVTQNPDGSVTLTLDQLIGVRPADEELAKLGVRAVVRKLQAGCREVGTLVRLTHPGAIFEMVETARAGNGLGGLRWIIHPAAIPRGDTLALSVQVDPHGRVPAVGGSIGLFRGRAPGCSRSGVQRSASRVPRLRRRPAR
ncbi:MAG TPA: hypothetical protein VMF09_16020 [Solirubrobacteraceae bacterium]|nr:hypothetical protein [Solirubrobacteraceae bacterium]